LVSPQSGSAGRFTVPPKAMEALVSSRIVAVRSVSFSKSRT